MEGESEMAVFKPPYGTSAERQDVVLEEGELMFDTTRKAFYTGDGTPGGRPVNETTVTIAGTESLPPGSNALFEETEESTPQVRIYKFKYPQAVAVQPAVCLAVNGTNSNLCTVRKVTVAGNGSSVWNGEAESSVLCGWETPAEE